MSSSISEPTDDGIRLTSIVKSDFFPRGLVVEEHFGKLRPHLVKKRVEMLAGTLLVKSQQGVAAADFTRSLLAKGASFVEPLPVRDWYRVGIREPRDPASLRRSSQALSTMRGIVEIVEPDFVVKPFEVIPSDPRFSSQWGMDNPYGTTTDRVDIEAARGWELRTDASGIVVAIIDTGIRTSHEDLAPNLWTNPGEVPGDAIDNDGNGWVDDIHGIDLVTNLVTIADNDGHGSHVAGIVGARGNNGLGVAGTAWAVGLMNVTFLTEEGGATSKAAESIAYALQAGADIINASWGSESPSALLEDAIREAGEAGVIVVAAAGNDTRNIDHVPTYPAAYNLSNLVSVGASEPFRPVADLSNYGESDVDIFAPGVNVISVDSSSDQSYTSKSGTSMAAPHVSGILALLKAEFPGDDHLQTVNRLLRSSVKDSSFASVSTVGGAASLARALLSDDNHPYNDDVADAHVFDDVIGVWRGHNLGSGAEPEEILFAPGVASHGIWFQWTAPDALGTDLHYQSSGQTVVAAVFAQESDGSLSKLAENSSQGSSIAFPTTAGGRYLIRISSVSLPDPAIEIAVGRRPHNDDFDAAEVLSGTEVQVTGTNVGASLEPGEPDAATRGVSVWYRWQAPASQPYVFAAGSREFQTHPAIYRTGEDGLLESVGTRTTSAAIGGKVVLDTVAGETYYIMVDAAMLPNANRTGEFVLVGTAQPLRIVVEPEDLVVDYDEVGELWSFAVSRDPLEIRWYRNGQFFSIGNQLTSVRGVDSGLGDYHAEWTAGGTTLPSTTASVTGRPAPPELENMRRQDGSVIVWGGTDTYTEGSLWRVFSRVTGFGPLEYRWEKDGVAVPGATALWLDLSPLTPSDAGSYRLVAANPFGEIVSEEHTLVVVPRDWTWSDRRGIGSQWTTFQDSQLIGKSGDDFYRSTDGHSWERVAALERITFNSFPIYGAGRWWSQTEKKAGSIPYVLYDISADLPDDWLGAMIGHGDVVFAKGSDGLLRKRAGEPWEHVPEFSDPPHRMGRTNGNFYVPEREGVSLSADGDTWIFHETPFRFDGGYLVHALGQWIASSVDGVYTSPDLSNWANEGFRAFNVVTDGRWVVAQTSNTEFRITSDLETWISDSVENGIGSFSQDIPGLIITDSGRVLDPSPPAPGAPRLRLHHFPIRGETVAGGTISPVIEVLDSNPPGRLEIFHNGELVNTIENPPAYNQFTFDVDQTLDFEARYSAVDGRLAVAYGSLDAPCAEPSPLVFELPPSEPRGIVFAGGEFIRADLTGISTSVDGLAWRHEDFPLLQGETIASIQELEGTVVVSTIKGGSFSAVMVRRDGEFWTRVTDPNFFGSSVRGEAFGIGATPATTVSSHSFDGQRWYLQTEGYSLSNVYSSAYGNGAYVASSSTMVLSALRDEPPVASFEGKGLIGVSYDDAFWGIEGSGQFFGDSGTDVYRSEDGITWLPTAPLPEQQHGLQALGGRVFTEDYTTSDGASWDPIIGGPGERAVIVAAGGRFAAIRRSDKSLFLSSDGITWQRDAGREASRIATDGTRFVALGPEVHVSTAGQSWETPLSSIVSANLLDAAGPPGGAIAVGLLGGIVAETDNGWEMRPISPVVRLSQIAFGHSMYTAVAADNQLFTSPDGNDWTSPPFATGRSWKDVTSRGDSLSAFSASGDVATWNPAAGVWDIVTPETPFPLDRAISGEGRHLAFELDSANIGLMIDGQGWTPHQIDPGFAIRDCAFGHGTFVAVSSSGSIASSPDGETWESLQLDESPPLQSIATTSDGFLALASGGELFRSDRQGKVWLSAGATDPILNDVVAAAGRVLGLAYTSVLDLGEGAASNYESWAACLFSPWQLQDPTIGALASDPDGDGFANWQEYLMGTSPTSHDADTVLAITRSETGSLVVQYNRNPNATGGRLVLESTIDLEEWVETAQTPIPAGSGEHTQTLQLTFDPSSEQQLALRIRFEWNSLP